MDYAEIKKMLWGSGLIVRGGFHPEPEDLIPEFDGQVGTVVIVGNAGAAMWQVFASAPEYLHAKPREHPLNAWTERVLGDAATSLGAAVLFPFGGPPYHPFQRWAQKADDVFPSPIGPLVHVTYGLWHAYRGALIFDHRLQLPSRRPQTSPCDDCAAKPCLSACPVDAFSARGYDVPRCIDHISRPDGTDCINLGCRARRACPVGTAFQYHAEQASFHQQHFLDSNRQTEDREPGF